MGDVFTPLDLIIFFTALVGVMAVGLIAGRKENTSEDYFLAGRSVPWWGVAGSIFGSNVSANHMVGMMGIGFSIGFAQSHFELGAIFGLMVLCYGFLPVYRKLNVYTLSEYLGRRYDERSRLAYAIIMILIMVVVQMVPGLYIGARSICVLMGGDAMETVSEVQTDRDVAAGSEATNVTVQTRNVNQTYYNVFVIALAVVAAAYTVFGGLKAVIWTDVIQSALLLAAGIGVALLTFQKIGGWGEMMALDQAGAHKMRLYRPMNDPDLPWTGVFTGLMAMHCFYWGTNQFIVQRALGARSDSEARLGIVAAGFLKLLIPFFAIGTGVAAYYLFQSENLAVAP
ncbi:MAG: transporter, partial [Planctomycetes bacterium]|nr:transporter [Planctomycetota bacterium]